ncbi:MAG: hypothetical protein HY787_16000 [Deltaproteobacteria bacterium]|nr:hypothetical protein [Deltaproteobacteria bacterium]
MKSAYGIRMDASWGARHTASGWMPLQKLDKVERPERADRTDLQVFAQAPEDPEHLQSASSGN